MFETIGVPELLIIGAAVLLLFGVGRVGRLGKDLGTSVKEFRRAVREDDDEPVPSASATAATVEEPLAHERGATGPRIF